MRSSFPHINPEAVPDNWRIINVGTQAGLPVIWWSTPEGSKMTVGLITGYVSKWRELLLSNGKTPEQADAIINGPVKTGP